eukprot:CAMPEP_0197851592 /NCGR_PEP_ID=MMETSP1438-20131217/18405_1 /TAXON_ID=1461541 /ORGANISM="Pterosperma sp., Strain CCMP1384" /LENGTH=227 /DNA_ID=CAMNT_0043465235 /DNA_START=214 /DNA_END=894 /DNA_ORIENTATION=+
MKVLVLGGTGGVGKLVVSDLLSRRIEVKVLVRSPDKLADLKATYKDQLDIIPGTALDVGQSTLATYLQDCEFAVSCLGHTLSWSGVYGAPRLLCFDTVRLVCQAAETNRKKLKLIILSSAGCDNPNGSETPRGWGEWTVLELLKLLVPPHKDNVMASRYLGQDIGEHNEFVSWVAVRPDDFLEGEKSDYVLHEKLANGLFNAGKSTKANIAHFFGDLVEKPEIWKAW